MSEPPETPSEEEREPLLTREAIEWLMSQPVAPDYAPKLPVGVDQ